MPSVSIIDPAAPIPADTVVVGVVPGERGPRLARGAKPIEAELGRQLTAALRALNATGRADEVLRIPTLGLAPFDVVVTTGLGDDARNPESIRRAVGAALRTLDDRATVHVAIDGPVGALAEGALLGSYRFTEYKSTATKPALRRVTLAAEDDAQARAELKRAKIVV
jgi:leucyl aminopeptidase